MTIATLTQDQLAELTEELAEQAIERAVATLRVSLVREAVHQKAVLTETEAALYMGVSVDVVNRYIRGSRLPQGCQMPLPARKVGRNYFIRREALEAWLTDESGRPTEMDRPGSEQPIDLQ